MRRVLRGLAILVAWGFAAAASAKDAAPAPDTLAADVARIARAIESRDAYERSPAGRRDSDDSAAAAQSAAGLAKIMAVIASVETTITAIGVGLVYFTLKAAQRSARAAEETLDSSKRIGEAQVRAYISISNLNMSFDIDNNHRPNIQFVAKNLGQSPARSLRTNVTLDYELFREKLHRVGDREWSSRPGYDVAASSDLPLSIKFGDGSITEFVKSTLYGDGEASVKVSLLLDYKFVDVFDKERSGNEYFSGIAQLSGTRWNLQLRPDRKPSARPV